MDVSPRLSISSDRTAAIPQKAVAAALSASGADVPAKSHQISDLAGAVLAGRINALKLFVPTMALPQSAREMTAGLSLLFSGKGGNATLGSLAAILGSVTVDGGDSALLKTVLSRALFPQMRASIDRSVRAAADEIAAGVRDSTAISGKHAARQTLDTVLTTLSAEKTDPSGDIVAGWFVYAHLDRRGRVRVRYDRASKRGCFFELALDSAVLGSMLFGLTVADGALALDVWAAPDVAETVRGEMTHLVQGLKARGISLRTWRVESFSDGFCGLDTRA